MRKKRGDGKPLKTGNIPPIKKIKVVKGSSHGLKKKERGI